MRRVARRPSPVRPRARSRGALALVAAGAHPPAGVCAGRRLRARRRGFHVRLAACHDGGRHAGARHRPVPPRRCPGARTSRWSATSTAGVRATSSTRPAPASGRWTWRSPPGSTTTSSWSTASVAARSARAARHRRIRRLEQPRRRARPAGAVVSAAARAVALLATVALLAAPTAARVAGVARLRAGGPRDLQGAPAGASAGSSAVFGLGRTDRATRSAVGRDPAGQ